MTRPVAQLGARKGRDRGNARRNLLFRPENRFAM